MLRYLLERAAWPPGRSWRSLVTVALTLVTLGACTASEDIFDPPGVSSITLTSAADSVVATGFNVQVSVEVIATDGLPLSGASQTWASSNTSVATVSTSGLVTTLSTGSTTISATTDDVTGSLVLRVVDADVSGLTALLADAFLNGLVAVLSSSTSSTVNTQLSSCNAGLSSGGMLDVFDCLTTAQGTQGDGGGTDTSVLAVLDLFWAYAFDLLNFGR